MFRGFNFTFFLGEKEIVFRPFTTFKVGDVKIEKDLSRKEDIYHIELKEAYPDLNGRKVLVWIDDVDSNECHEIMDHSERYGVTCVRLHTTNAAEDFFSRKSKLLNRNINKLRVITDMVRDEDGKRNIEAGLQLAQLLKKLNYNQGILCFTGSQYLIKNQEKFKNAGLTNVYATCIRDEAQLFAKFEGLPGTLSSYSSPSISSTS